VNLKTNGFVSPNVSEQQNSGEPKPTEAIEGILKIFDRFPLVALGELHGSRTQHDFIVSLIQHPDFPDKVNDIVVEFGNALYQPVMDRYIAGANVVHTELRQVWRNTTQITMLFDLPIYERFFVTVRAVNQHLPKQKELRVLLGDPPVDWSIIENWAQHDSFLMSRDDHFANVIKREVLGKKRRALLIAGAGHLYRASLRNVTRRLDQLHPGAVFVVIPHGGFEEKSNDELEKRLASWPQPGLAHVKNTWLGNLDPDVTFPEPKRGISIMPDGSIVPAPRHYEGMKIQEITDAYLYLGPEASLVKDVLPPEIWQDAEYQHELQRRSSLPRNEK
jgi:hypothetical protein